LACGCTRLGCGAVLVTRNVATNVKVAHFAHYQALECATGLQTAIHLAAKDIIAQPKAVHQLLNKPYANVEWDCFNCQAFRGYSPDRMATVCLYENMRRKKGQF
jgi:hypothetical protein